MSDYPICPRCGGYIPNNERPGEYPGALSRTDNETYVCSWCGELEAMEQLLLGAPMPKKQWEASS